MPEQAPREGRGGKRLANHVPLSYIVGQVSYTEEQRRAAEPGKGLKPLGRRLLRAEVELMGQNGPIRVRALLDSGAEGNFLSNMVAKEAGLKQTIGDSGRFETLNGQRLDITGVTKATYRVGDSQGRWKGCTDQVQVGRIHGFDMILGMPVAGEVEPSNRLHGEDSGMASEKGQKVAQDIHIWARRVQSRHKGPRR